MTLANNTELDALSRLASSAAHINLAGQRYGTAELIARGRKLLSNKPHILLGLCRIENADMLALLLASFCSRQACLLAADPSLLAKRCAVIYGAADQGISVTQGEHSAECRGDFAVLSSGTLGDPKLIWHDINATLSTADLVRKRLELNAQSRVLISVPLHHMYGLGAALLPALLAGSDIYFLPKSNLLTLYQALTQIKPDFIYSTPHQMRPVLKRLRPSTSRQQHLVLAGDAVTPELAIQAQQCLGQCFNLYGSSELGVVAISAANEVHRLQALEGVSVRSEAVHDCGDTKEQGETLWVQHPYAAKGWCRDQHFQKLARWWNSRDVAAIHPDGTFSLRGRADLSVNRAGKLLVLAELEQQLMSWPEIEMAVASVLPQQQAGGLTLAVLIQTAASHVNGESIHQLALERLPYFARPDCYHLATAIPCLASGKPDRKKIMREYYDEPNRNYPTVTAAAR